MLQNGSVMMPGGHLAHAELQQQHVAVAALAHEALVPPKTLAPRPAGTCRRTPTVEMGSGGRLAQHEVDVSRVVGPLLLETGVEVVASMRFARGANA